jgi:hypothetical protein
MYITQQTVSCTVHCPFLQHSHYFQRSQFKKNWNSSTAVSCDLLVQVQKYSCTSEVMLKIAKALSKRFLACQNVHDFKK